MKLKENELKVFYQGELNSEMDNDLSVLLKKYGYTNWASGMDLVDNVRDLAFDRKV